MLKLHPKYGVNPSIPICFWCEKDKNAVVLLGNKYKGEAPRHILLDYEPCDECKEMMDLGCVIIEVSETNLKDRPEIQKDVWPTGRWLVMKQEAFDQNFPTSVGVKKVFADRELYALLLSLG